MAAGPVDWSLAERVAVRVAGTEALARSYHHDSVGPDIAELAPIAERLVAEVTGLTSVHGTVRAEVVDRAGWIRANLASFQRLLGPHLDRWVDRLGSSNAMARAATRTATGVELGTLLGWMSKRVLGQYDLLVADPADPAGSDGAGDTVYLVGPNLLSLEKRFGFPPREFRMWLCLHEVTHRAQFTGVPWMHAYYRGLVDETLTLADPNPGKLLESLRDGVKAIRRDGLRAFDDGGIAGVLASPAQREVMARIGGLMSLLEGHGDVTMDRAGAGHVPSAERFGRVLRERRKQQAPLVALVQKLLGIEAKLSQYAQGEAFLAAIESELGPRAIDRCWEGPELLPSLEEIRRPDAWLARVGGARVGA
jgi:coenzyme F420 biosynthesis associated uncharacterized protein